MDIFNAYIHNARPIAIFHGVLALGCFVCLVIQRFQLAKETAAYKKRKPGVLDTPGTSEFSRVSRLTLAMTTKGEIPNLEAIRVRLLRHLSKLDIIIRFCLNAFIISGLLGTLFNLWNLGPGFWNDIIKAERVDGQQAIGIAFSASFFGLGLALVFSLLDSVVVRFVRELFVQKASAAIFDDAAKFIPPTERAAVAEALERFYAGSTGLLEQFRNQHVQLSRDFISQIKSSSDTLDEKMTAISGSWSELVQNATTTTEEFGIRISGAADKLSVATNDAQKALTSASSLLAQTQDLSKLLVEIRAESAKLHAQMTQWTSDFGEQWRADLSQSIETHAKNIGVVYDTGLSRFDKSANDWQEKNAETIKNLSSALEKSFENLRDERQTIETQINRLIEAWQSKLGQSATGVGTGLSAIQSETVKLEQAIASLATTQTAAAKDLKNALDDLKTFSQNVSKETLLGSAIANLQTAISDLGRRLNSNGKDGPATVSVLFPDSESIESILRELQALSAKISTNIPAPRPYAPPPPPPPKLPQPGPRIVITEDPAPPKRSLWKKFNGLFRGNRSKSVGGNNAGHR